MTELRIYILDGKPMRLPLDSFNRTYPQFANTRQRVIWVCFDKEKPHDWQLLSRPGLRVHDADGNWDRVGQMDDFALPVSADKFDGAKKEGLSEAEKALITADVTGKERIPFIRAERVSITASQFRDALAAAGLKQNRLAKVLGIDVRTVNRWATGKLPVPQYVEAYFNALAGRAGK